MGDPLDNVDAALAEHALGAAPLGGGGPAPPPTAKGPWVYDEAGNGWKRGTTNDTGAFGELGAAFSFDVKSGYALLNGPGGPLGHAPNASGPDCVAFTTTGPLRVLVVDNKTYASTSVVASASALQKNLATNLNELAAVAARPEFDGVGRIGEIRSALARAVSAVQAGEKLPEEVQLVVTNYGGNSRGISAAMSRAGIAFVDMRPERAIQAQSQAGAAVGAAMGQFAMALHALNGRAWAREFETAAEAALERLMPEIERRRRAGRWVIVMLTLEVARSVDVLGLTLGLREAPQKPRFIALRLQDGRTPDEAANPPSEGATIRAATPEEIAHPPKPLEPTPEGRRQVEEQWLHFAPIESTPVP